MFPIYKETLLQPLVQWNQQQIALLTGDRSILSIAHLWMAYLAMSGREVYVIDCAIRFDVYALSREIQYQNEAPEIVLSRIKIRRDFTPYQLLTTVKEIIANPKSNIYFILSPTKQFFDGDVAEEEGLFLLRKLVKYLQIAQAAQTPILLIEKPGYRHPNFAKIYPYLYHLAKTVWRAEHFVIHKKINRRQLWEEQ